MENNVSERGHPDSVHTPQFFYDFDFCYNIRSLKSAFLKINDYGYDLISVTQSFDGVYTVFFRRPARE